MSDADRTYGVIVVRHGVVGAPVPPFAGYAAAIAALRRPAR